MNEHQHIDWKMYFLFIDRKIVITKDLRFRHIVISDIQDVTKSIVPFLVLSGFHFYWNNGIVTFHIIIKFSTYQTPIRYLILQFLTFFRQLMKNPTAHWKFRNYFIYLLFGLINTNNMSQLNRLKAVLAEQDKTGKWLAEQLGKSTCTISKWCKNTAQPDLKTLAQIAQCLNVKVADIINEPKGNEKWQSYE